MNQAPAGTAAVLLEAIGPESLLLSVDFASPRAAYQLCDK
jgi:hypothetical protein